MAVLGLAAGEAGASPLDRALLDAADRAWAEGRRVEARAGWLAVEQGEDPALVAQAAVRLLMVSGNLGLATHGPRADRALAACPPADPWCALAEADYTLFVASLGLPADPQRAVEQARFAAPALPGPAQARLVWAGAVPLQDLAPDADGLSAAVAAGGGRWLPGPGTWVLGLGVVGAPGLGLGGTVRFFHPDLGLVGKRLDVGLVATSRGVLQASGQLRTPGPRWARLAAHFGRRPYDVYGPLGGRKTRRLATVQASAAPGIRVGPGALWLGPQLRLDWEGPWLGPAPLVHGHGARGGWAWEGLRSGRGAWVGVEAEGALADYAHLDFVVDGRRYGSAPGGAWALRAVAAVAPLASTPVYRLPSAGGGELLRSPAAGRFRSPALAVTVLEWRLREARAFGGVLFAEGAWVHVAAPSALPLHGGLGAGLRLRLPPRPHNTVRLDAAWGDAGFGLTVGVGEAF